MQRLDISVKKNIFTGMEAHILGLKKILDINLYNYKRLLRGIVKCRSGSNRSRWVVR